MTDSSSGEERLLVISSDSHVGPSMRNDLRPYCPAEHLEAFDEYEQEMADLRDQISAAPKTIDLAHVLAEERLDQFTRALRNSAPNFSPVAQKSFEMSYSCPGLNDPAMRHADMDREGVAADVIFAGGQNGEVLPFLGAGFTAGPKRSTPEQQALGCRIYNQWLADFVSTEPARHIGAMQMPIWNVDAAIAEMKHGRESGLKAVNFPAPRRDFPTYNDPIYEPFWSACVDLDLPLLSHAGGGDPALGATGTAGHAMFAVELMWLGRRALWQMIFSGVFERHPKLRIVFTEQGTEWVPLTLREMDSLSMSPIISDAGRQIAPRLPSEYWATNVYLTASFPAPFELALRDQIGLDRVLWGSDYPHAEGTFPFTREALRFALAGIPDDEIKMLIGGNALQVYDFDRAALQKIAARIGPTVDEIREPLETIPEPPGLAFRSVSFFT